MKQQKWNDIPEFPGYQACKAGQIRSIDRIGINGRRYKGKILKSRVDDVGYIFFTLYKEGKAKHVRLHRILAKLFIPNPKNLPQVNHKNGIKTDYCLKNLEWTTAKGNADHAYKIGLSNQIGEAHSNAKLSDFDIRNIRKDYDSGEFLQKELSKKYNVGRAQICRIINGIRWNHIK